MSIEQNLERIADALEIIARAADQKEPEARQPQTAAQLLNVPATPQAVTPAPAQVPVQAVPAAAYPAAVPASVPVSQAVTAPPPMPPMPAQVPTTATARQYSFDQLAVATAALAAQGKDVFAILGKFGVNMLMDLPQERFGEYAAALREAGAVI